MQKKKLTISFFYSIILLLFGCTRHDEASNLLFKASKLANNNPINALKVLDSISTPSNSLSKELYMQYIVRHIQIYHKNYLPINDDSLIFKAIDYYNHNNNDPRLTSLAYFYGGVLLKEQKKYDKAMECYKNADKYAQQSLDSLSIGLINFNMGDLLSEQGRYDHALFKYKLAAKSYEHYPEKIAYAFSSIGRMYLFKEDIDSAFLFFHKGLKTAEILGDKKLRRQLTESLAVSFEQVKKYAESLKYLRYSISLNTDSIRLPRYYLNFALLYDKISYIDSTTFYAEKLKIELPRIRDNYLRASILNFLIQYEKKHQHISTAFDYQTDRMNVLIQIMKDREKQSIYKIEKKYNYEQIQKQYFESLTIKQRWIILLMTIVIFGGLSFLFYRAKQKNRLLAIQNKIETLTEMNSDLESMIQKKQLDLRKELLWRFDITKKFIKLNEEINKKGKPSTESGFLIKQFNTIVYGQSSLEEQWQTLHQAFNQTRPGYSEKMKQLYPEITETEFRICILTYADFSIKEIALILQQKPNTIQTRRTSLRKKLGVPNSGNIPDHIDKLFS